METKATETLKLALDALEAYGTKHANTYGLDGAWDKEITRGTLAVMAIREALAEQPAQTKQVVEKFDELEQPAQQQEPVGHLRMGPRQDFVTTSAAGELEISVWHPVYTSPQPTKPWVGLTDEETESIISDWFDGSGIELHHIVALCRAIETKLKEKNT